MTTEVRLEGFEALLNIQEVEQGGSVSPGDEYLRFQWTDRSGLIWHVVFYNGKMGFSGYTASVHERGTGAIHVQTHDEGFRMLSMAYLTDVRVDSRIENRGIGSMLASRAIDECKQRGHEGIEGFLSDADIDHFPKLKRFYNKLGFSVVFSDPKDADYRYNRAGEIEMIFNSA